jgi:hypothetical protein
MTWKINKSKGQNENPIPNLVWFSPLPFDFIILSCDKK